MHTLSPLVPVSRYLFSSRLFSSRLFSSHCLLFPGQGSQHLGMAKDLYQHFSVARETFHEVEESLSHKLTAVMWGTDATALNLTENAQPALLAHSVAVWRILQQELGTTLPAFASAVIGHSLGEYSAATCAGGISLFDMARLVRVRGRAMQEAVPVNVGGMAACMPLTLAQAEEVCRLIGQDPELSKSVCQV
jgi:[acyl-carrier-protein] S-malonyltransferase